MKKIRLIYKYLRDKEVSAIKKVLILGGLLYLVLPVDLVPDFLVGIGWLDDLLVVIFEFIAFKAELDEYSKSPGKVKPGGEGKIIDLHTRRKS